MQQEPSRELAPGVAAPKKVKQNITNKGSKQQDILSKPAGTGENKKKWQTKKKVGHSSSLEKISDEKYVDEQTKKIEPFQQKVDAEKVVATTAHNQIKQSSSSTSSSSPQAPNSYSQEPTTDTSSQQTRTKNKKLPFLENQAEVQQKHIMKHRARREKRIRSTADATILEESSPPTSPSTASPKAIKRGAQQKKRQADTSSTVGSNHHEKGKVPHHHHHRHRDIEEGNIPSVSRQRDAGEYPNDEEDDTKSDYSTEPEAIRLSDSNSPTNVNEKDINNCHRHTSSIMKTSRDEESLLPTTDATTSSIVIDGTNPLKAEFVVAPTEDMEALRHEMEHLRSTQKANSVTPDIPITNEGLVIANEPKRIWGWYWPLWKMPLLATFLSVAILVGTIGYLVTADGNDYNINIAPTGLIDNLPLTTNTTRMPSSSAPALGQGTIRPSVPPADNATGGADVTIGPTAPWETPTPTTAPSNT